ncbi:hypothetical protein ACFL20_09340, partial [Spirochaetota bacterium]
ILYSEKNTEIEYNFLSNINESYYRNAHYGFSIIKYLHENNELRIFLHRLSDESFNEYKAECFLDEFSSYETRMINDFIIKGCNFIAIEKSLKDPGYGYAFVCRSGYYRPLVTMLDEEQLIYSLIHNKTIIELDGIKDFPKDLLFKPLPYDHFKIISGQYAKIYKSRIHGNGSLITNNNIFDYV